MRKLLLLIFIMIATGVAGCETVRQVKAGCFGHWIESNDNGRSGHKRGTRWSNKFNKQPYRQCVDENVPYKDTEKRPYG